jgi:chaperonin cofactor prefoldin
VEGFGHSIQGVNEGERGYDKSGFTLKVGRVLFIMTSADDFAEFRDVISKLEAQIECLESQVAEKEDHIEKEKQAFEHNLDMCKVSPKPVVLK